MRGPNGERQRRCPKCKGWFAPTEFGSNSTSSDGLQTYCRLCRNKVRAEKNKGDINHRLKHHIAVRVKSQMAGVGGVPDGYVKDLEQYLGYKMWELKRSLSSDIFKREGVTLRVALSRGYHIDHKRPLSSFAPQALGDDEFRACWAISNLWAIPAVDNLAKGAKYDGLDTESFPSMNVAE